MRLLWDHVLLKRKPREETTRSGIIIPANVNDPSIIGEIVAVGPGPVLRGQNFVEDMPVIVGDWVTWKKYAGRTKRINGEEFLLMRAIDLDMIVEDGENVMVEDVE